MTSAQLVLSLTLSLLLSAASCRPQLQPDTRSGLVIPERIISPQARLDYAIAHYWDKSPQWTPEHAAELELWIADYSGLIAGQAPSKVRQPLISSLDYIPSELIPLTLASYRRQLLDSASLLHDEHSYALLLLWARHSPKLDSAQQEGALEELRLLRKRWSGPAPIDSIILQDSLTRADSLAASPQPLPRPRRTQPRPIADEE